MRSVLAATLTLLLASCGKQPRSIPTETFTLDFRSGHNLKLVYDAGVRPWKEPHDPYPQFAYECHVGNPGLETDDQELNSWTILLPGGEQFSIATSWVKFQILEDFDIGRIDFRGTVRDARDAAVVAKRVCTAMNIAAAVADTPENLIERAADRVAWNAGIMSSGVDFSIAFWVTSELRRNKGSNNVCLLWRDYLPKDVWKAPLKKPLQGMRPPPGYEGSSMDPPWYVR